MRKRSIMNAFRMFDFTKGLLIGVVVLWLLVVLVVPIIVLIIEAFSAGWLPVWQAITQRDSIVALKLTLWVTLFTIPVNLIMGFLTAWCLVHFSFKGKALLIALIDLPLSISPVIAGLLFILLFGAQSFLAPWLAQYDIKIIFALPGIILATLFITYPYVVKSLIPLMRSQGYQEEEAARTLGASPLQLILRITLPKVRWGLAYGIILSTARALGEFGAVAVVAGYVRGKTVTMPLQIEIYYNEYEFVAAFACSALLGAIALLMIVTKHLIEYRMEKYYGSSNQTHT